MNPEPHETHKIHQLRLDAKSFESLSALSENFGMSRNALISLACKELLDTVRKNGGKLTLSQ